MWRIAFLPSAGPDIGLGHVSRCLALARAAAAQGGEPVFVIGDARAATLLGASGMTVVSAPWPSEAAAARDALRALSAETIVVDSYAATADFLASLRAITADVVVVDDLADRSLPVHVVVNGGLGAEHLPYRRTPGTHWLLGPRYAPLDASFAEEVARDYVARPGRVFVGLGGGPHLEATLAALAAVEAALPGCTVDVIAGALSADADALQTRARATGGGLTVHRQRVGLRDLMLAADVAVTGAGVTLHELAATATPAVVVRMADNQAPNAEAAAREGVALVAGGAREPGLRERIESALRRLSADPALRATLGRRGRNLVDGQGAWRVIGTLTRALAERR